MKRNDMKDMKDYCMEKGASLCSTKKTSNLMKRHLQAQNEIC